MYCLLKSSTRQAHSNSFDHYFQVLKYFAFYCAKCFLRMALNLSSKSVLCLFCPFQISRALLISIWRFLWVICIIWWIADCYKFFTSLETYFELFISWNAFLSNFRRMYRSTIPSFKSHVCCGFSAFRNQMLRACFCANLAYFRMDLPSLAML